MTAQTSDAALVFEVNTGKMVAYVGNTPETTTREHGNNVDIITAPRSTGSILKPFLYAAMLNDGLLLPNTLVPDIPMQIGGFIPENGFQYRKADFHPPVYLAGEDLHKQSFSDRSSWFDAGSIWLTFEAMVEVSRPDAELQWQQLPCYRRLRVLRYGLDSEVGCKNRPLPFSPTHTP